MYPEFIAIYVGLAVIGVISIVNLVLLIILFRNNGTRRTVSSVSMGTMSPQQTVQPNNNIAFCKKCAAQFSSFERFCPQCGTPR